MCHHHCPPHINKKKIVFIFETKIANHYTMESSSSKGECPSVFSVEMTQKEALRKAADPLASVWCPKSTTGSPLTKAKQGPLNIQSNALPTELFWPWITSL